MMMTHIKNWISHLAPTQQIVLSFVFVILTGATLLSLPISNVSTPAPFIDHLFISTSAVCVTGLATIYPVNEYNFIGQSIMIVLMQIGGLGLMTLIAVFVIFVEGKLTLHTKLAMSEAVNRSNFFDFHHFMVAIVKYTIFFEGIGFILLSIRFIPQFGFGQGLYNALFVAVSAFCNAGFDNFSTTSLTGYVSDPLVSLVVAGLIVVGGLGFGVWFDISQGTKSILRGEHGLRYVLVHLKVHAKLVITMTIALILSGMFLIYIFEFNNPNSLAPLSFIDQVVATLFQSVTLRTAGFSTLNIGLLKPTTLLIMIVYMFIGGSPGGTAGGIKTTTFAILILMIIAELSGKDAITVFHRRIEREQFRKAFIVFFMLLSTLFVGILLLLWIEPFDALSIMFEATSAIGTVGLSMGITPNLSDVGKSIIIALMYLGRIGPLTLLLAVNQSKSKKGSNIIYPNADILIG